MASSFSLFPFLKYFELLFHKTKVCRKQPLYFQDRGNVCPTPLGHHFKGFTLYVVVKGSLNQLALFGVNRICRGKYES